MALVGHELMLRYLQNVRVMHIDGYFGSGKTALSFMIANELMKTGDYRYIISNIKSVWSDDIQDVTLRDGVHADAIVILDEAGEFMRTASQANEWISYLRKLRIVLILPSARPPAASVRALRVARVWDGFSIGLPLWNYKILLDTAYANEKTGFKWWFPNQIWGIYDTEGYPADESQKILDWIKSITQESAANLGYANQSGKQPGSTSSSVSQFSEISLDAVESIERAIEGINKVQAKTQQSLSVLESKKKRRRK